MVLPFAVDGNHAFMGREVICTSREPEQINVGTIPDIINGAKQRHICNRRECIYLKKHFCGKHPILDRNKIVRSDINNKLSINIAWSIVRNSVGYFLGEPIQYTAKDEAYADVITKLNSYMDSEDKSCEDMNVGDSASITGRGFRLVATDKREYADEAPFEIPSLNSEDTEVIYSTSAGREPMLAFTHAPILSDSGTESGTKWTVYDKVYQYIYAVQGSFGTKIQGKDLVEGPKAHFLGDVPIVEYPNNEWRIGDFEIVLTILDAIDRLNSDRVNDVEQIVNAILVFQGLHLRTKEDNANTTGQSDFDKLKETMTLEFPSTDGTNAKVYYVSSNLDQSQAETLQETLMNYIYAITGIPDRKQKSGGTGDTGQAVYLRDGFQELEVVARVKERNFRKSERRTLRMICEVMRRFDDVKLRPMDIDIHFIRNRTDDLLNKSQALTNFVSSKVMTPTDGIALIGVTNDPKSMAERGKAYWDDQSEKLAAQTSYAAAEGENKGATTNEGTDKAN